MAIEKAGKRYYKNFVMLTVLLLSACGSEPDKKEEQNNNITTDNKAQVEITPKVQTSEIGQQSNEIYQEGIHYHKIGDPKRDENGKVEVVEVFWYGCPHCFSTEPYVEGWERTRPADARFTLLAAPLSGIWGFHAKVFYTNESLGITKKVHKATFNALHKEGRRMSSLDEVARYYSDNFGIDEEQYKNAFNSFSVDVKVREAVRLINKYQIQSVPNFVVGGAYRVNAESAKSTPGIFNVINYLINNKFPL